MQIVVPEHRCVHTAVGRVSGPFKYRVLVETAQPVVDRTSSAIGYLNRAILEDLLKGNHDLWWLSLLAIRGNEEDLCVL